jgi:cytochrome oxidase Cu insertion factor (SCO1/SenC/PrrC family)
MRTQRLALFWRAGAPTRALVCVGVVALGAIAWVQAGRSDAASIATAPGNGLLDQRGEPFAMHPLRGKTVVLNFIFTHCPGICPLQTQALRRVSAALPEAVRERVHFVSVSVDPERDTPSALAAFATKHGADQERWTFVTGQGRELLALGESCNPLDEPRLAREIQTVDELFNRAASR